jgi:AraC family transcriptional regulator, positive regulator of tynA and feaB
MCDKGGIKLVAAYADTGALRIGGCLSQPLVLSSITAFVHGGCTEMPGLESFSTASLPVHRRLEYWNDLNGNAPSPTVTDATQLSNFCPSLSRTSVDYLWLGVVCSSPAVVHHAHEHVARTREALFFLHIQLQGSSRHQQDGRVAELQMGDFTLLDSTRPYQMTFDAANEVLVLGIADAMLRRHLACPERLAAIRMSGQESLNSLLSDFALGLWRRSEGLELGSAGDNLANALLSLTAAAYAGVEDTAPVGSAHLEALRLSIIHHIEKHLCDCDLSPNSIAAMLKRSARYVHAIFTRGDETVSRYILRRRLEECARVLASRPHRARSVSAIAFDYGFSSCTNFGKVFREHYGVTPTEYRQEHCSKLPGSSPR